MIAVGGMLLAAVDLCAQGDAPDSYPRRNAETIRQTAQEILRSKRFAEKTSLMDRFWEWLFSWGLPSLGGTWATLLFWVLAIGAGLIVLAVLVHFIVSLVGAFRGRGRLGPEDPNVPHFKELGSRSYDELCQSMARLRENGDFRGAIGAMMAALLRWLEAAGLVGFDKAKTNGDYVREFPPADGREAFRRFVGDFDRTIYAGAACGASQYEQMKHQFEGVQAHVRPGP